MFGDDLDLLTSFLFHISTCANKNTLLKYYYCYLRQHPQDNPIDTQSLIGERSVYDDFACTLVVYMESFINDIMRI